MKKRQLALMVSLALGVSAHAQTETVNSVSENLEAQSTTTQSSGRQRQSLSDFQRQQAQKRNNIVVPNAQGTTNNLSVPETITEEPVLQQPVANEAIISEPVVTEPVINEPAVAEPVVAEPQISEPAVEVPTVSEPQVTQPVVETPAVSAPEISEPVIAEPELTEPVIEVPATEVPTVETTGTTAETAVSDIAPEDDINAIPEGITVLNEDDDFVVEQGLLGQDRRDDIEEYEEHLEARRCLGIIGVPGDVRLSPDAIKQMNLELEADEIEFPDENTVILSGRSVASQGPQQISGERLRYSKTDNIVHGEGNVDLYSPKGDHLKSSELEIDLDVFTGHVGEVEYTMAEREIYPRLSSNVFVAGRGRAEGGQFLGHDLMRFDNATYTLCPTGNEDVVLKAGEIELDYASNTGTARNAVMRFLGVPIFYLPYFTFPITNERKTGLLAAEFGTDRDEGSFFNVPIYWNIHPQLDATITPWYYTERGFMLETEFRYMTQKSDGIIRASILPDDNLYDDDERYAFTYIHDTDFTDNLEGSIDFQYASDEDYYDDFRTSLELSSSSYLPQRGELNYFHRDYSVDLGVQNYYSVNDSISEFNEPYERLPYVEFDSEFDGPLGTSIGGDASFNYFRHTERLDGTRYVVEPFVSYPLEEIYGYIEPKVAFKYIGYNLSEAVNEGGNSDPHVYNTITSVDSKLILEREFNWAGDQHIQTLEPRVKYVYIPDENQTALPDFDTSGRNVNNFSSIFEENRFYGDDRIGDTNQVTVGLTSRFLNDSSGSERAEFSVGQIYYFEDRQITLNENNADINDSESDLLGEGSLKLYNDWEVYGYTAWDPDESETRVRRATLSYNREEYAEPGNTYLNVGYYFTRSQNSSNESEQISAEAGYAINNAWSLFGRTVYDIDDDETRFLNGGVRYNACCWSISVMGEQSIDNDQEEEERIFVMFSLNGITDLDYDYGGSQN